MRKVQTQEAIFSEYGFIHFAVKRAFAEENFVVREGKKFVL